MPSYVKGVINLRGKVIPVIDVRRRFKLTEREDVDKTCIVVVNINNTLIGLVVDTVNDVAHIPEIRLCRHRISAKRTASFLSRIW